jgi:hypothetical protein
MDMEYVLCNNLMMKLQAKGLTGYEMMLYKQLCESLEAKERFLQATYELETRKQQDALRRTEEGTTRKVPRSKKPREPGEQSAV